MVVNVDKHEIKKGLQNTGINDEDVTIQTSCEIKKIKTQRVEESMTCFTYLLIPDCYGGGFRNPKGRGTRHIDKVRTLLWGL